MNTSMLMSSVHIQYPSLSSCGCVSVSDVGCNECVESDIGCCVGMLECDGVDRKDEMKEEMTTLMWMLFAW